MDAKTLLDLGNVLAIILSIVSLVVTTIGFFASMKFYRDGVKLQNSANDTLVRIEEKALSIQTQVASMFDKTLDAALGKSEKLDSNFDALNQQLENTAKAIVDNAVKKIGATGDEERKKLSSIVEKQMEPLRARLEETRESAVQVVETRLPAKLLSPRESMIFGILTTSARPLTLKDIADITGLPRQHTALYLRRLIDRDLIKRESKDGISHYSIIDKAIK